MNKEIEIKAKEYAQTITKNETYQKYLEKAFIEGCKMNLEFKITVEPHEHEDLIPYTNALQREAFLFELFNNFPRFWKHSEKEPTYQEVIDRIFELKQQYNVI